MQGQSARGARDRSAQLTSDSSDVRRGGDSSTATAWGIGLRRPRLAEAVDVFGPPGANIYPHAVPGRRFLRPPSPSPLYPRSLSFPSAASMLRHCRPPQGYGLRAPPSLREGCPAAGLRLCEGCSTSGFTLGGGSFRRAFAWAPSRWIWINNSLVLLRARGCAPALECSGRAVG